MKLLIVGASQGTGALAVQAALARGDEVTAFARSPQKLAIEHPRLSKVAGSFHDASAIEAAVVRQDAVIVTANAGSLKPLRDDPTFYSRGTGDVIAAMQKHAVRRLVVLSAMGVGDSRPLASAFLRALRAFGWFEASTVDHTREEALVRASGLDWVLARPPLLTNGPARGRAVKTAEIRRPANSLSRADLANFLVESTSSSEWLGKAVQIAG